MLTTDPYPIVAAPDARRYSRRSVTARRAGQRAALTAIVVVLSLFQAPALAETMYVTDILRLGLHRASDTSDTPFRTLVSGDELEVLSRTRFYARVRTSDGQTGWVKASYLVDEKPAQARLADLTAERDALAQQLAELRSRLATQDNELQSIRVERERLQQDAAATSREVETLRADNQSLGERVFAYRYSVQMRWVLLTALSMLVLGLIAGWWWCDWKHRQRHGGFRI